MAFMRGDLGERMISGFRLLSELLRSLRYSSFSKELNAVLWPEVVAESSMEASFGFLENDSSLRWTLEETM